MAELTPIDDDKIQMLAHQLAALPGFRWLDGMLVCNVHFVHTVRLNRQSRQGLPGPTWGDTYRLDLHDAATGGILLDWLVVVGLEPAALHGFAGWAVVLFKEDVFKRFEGASLAEACAKALIDVGRCA